MQLRVGWSVDCVALVRWYFGALVPGPLHARLQEHNENSASLIFCGFGFLDDKTGRSPSMAASRHSTSATCSVLLLHVCLTA